ncbi:lactonase family protein [Candidimonas nitroreducens]|nr:beta-propeller fold lactonase family protein [Candidimonas nitroreducens]
MPATAVSEPGFRRDSPGCFVYVSCAGTKEIHIFRLNEADGRLHVLGAAAVPGTSEPSPASMPMALSPDRRILYAALRSAPFPVSAFVIDQVDGGLSCRGTAPLPAAMAYLSVSRDGLLLGASYTEGKISVNRIDIDGVPQSPPVQTIDTPPKAHCIVEGQNGVCYATTVSGNAILAWRKSVRGQGLGLSGPVSTACRSGSGPRHLAFHPRLPVMYCINELAGSLTVFAIEESPGELVELQSISLMPPDFQGNALAADVHVRPDGCFVYASVRSTNLIAALRVDMASGRVECVGYYGADPSPRGFAIDPSGQFLVCAGQRSATVVVYDIDASSGALAQLHRYSVGSNANWVEIVPFG